MINGTLHGTLLAGFGALHGEEEEEEAALPAHDGVKFSSKPLFTQVNLNVRRGPGEKEKGKLFKRITTLTKGTPVVGYMYESPDSAVAKELAESDLLAFYTDNTAIASPHKDTGSTVSWTVVRTPNKGLGWAANSKGSKPYLGPKKPIIKPSGGGGPLVIAPETDKPPVHPKKGAMLGGIGVTGAVAIGVIIYLLMSKKK